MLDTSICKTGATLAPDLALLVSHGKAPLGSPAGWIRVGSGRETYAEEGAASPRPHAGALSQLLPLVGSFLLVPTRDPPEGVWLRSPQGWASLGRSRLVRGLLLAGQHPGWPPHARLLRGHCTLSPPLPHPPPRSHWI